jgi:hypothetical protein
MLTKRSLFQNYGFSDSKKLSIYLIRDGHYIESDNSPNFPNIPITQIIAATVQQAWQVGIVQTLEEFEETINKSIS